MAAERDRARKRTSRITQAEIVVVQADLTARYRELEAVNRELKKSKGELRWRRRRLQLKMECGRLVAEWAAGSTVSPVRAGDSSARDLAGCGLAVRIGVGNKITDRAKPRYQRRAIPRRQDTSRRQRPLGNEVAASTVCGVGGSRTVMRNSTQGTHGPVNPGQPNPGANKPIFPGFK